MMTNIMALMAYLAIIGVTVVTIGFLAIALLNAITRINHEREIDRVRYGIG